MVSVLTPRSILIKRGLDVSAILKQLDANPQLWNVNEARKSVGQNKPHAAMSDIWVRYNHPAKVDPANLAAFNNEHVPFNYPAWYLLPALQTVIFNLMSEVQGEMLGGVLITRIPPRGGILPHVDTGWHVNYYKKFYLALKAPMGAVFSFQDDGAPDSTREDVRPKTGELHFIDNRKRHWVENNSDEERMTAIICIRTAQPRFGGYND